MKKILFLYLKGVPFENAIRFKIDSTKKQICDVFLFLQKVILLIIEVPHTEYS